MPRAGWIAVAFLTAGLSAPVAAQPLPPLLGAPVGVKDKTAPPANFNNTQPENNSPPPRAATLGAPRPVGSTAANRPAPAAPVPSELVEESIARTSYQPPASDPVSDFLKERSELRQREPDRTPGNLSKESVTSNQIGDGELGERFNQMLGQGGGGRFRSDHAFDSFVSPVTNPFLFEDPRSLTELRPIFIYQKIPSSNPDFRGGNVSFLGTQGRVAFTERWSLVFHKFGGIRLNPNDSSRYDDETGFAEIWLGPKWTFLRSEQLGIAAAGLQFQLPVGSKSTFQNTGDLSLVPYVSYAKNFFPNLRYGSVNLMASTGYSLSVNSERSDYYWLSAHVDFNVAHANVFYPLVEMNWFVVTSKGQSTPIGVEGRDLINFGGQASGTGLLTTAFGARGKISESAQIGAAFEIPIAGRKDLFRYRFTVDFIWRY